MNEYTTIHAHAYLGAQEAKCSLSKSCLVMAEWWLPLYFRWYSLLSFCGFD